MPIENHSFCWNGIATSDPESAKSFYSAAIGWNATEHSFPNGETSTMFIASDRPRAHLRGTEPGEPDQWTSYLRVEDVDASVAAAVKAGGSEFIPPTDIAPGRFAAVRSPSGAGLCLFREGDEAADNAPDEVGGV
ncbi:MAG: VOC family protein, partial [Longimicrobiales bacterium]